MSTRQDGAPPSPTVRSRDDLVKWIADGSKPRSMWRIGTEHEKFVFHTDSLGPVPYEGPRGIRALMQALIDRYGWEPVIEGENIIALRRPKGQGSETVSLEPGGQFELSGAPVETLHETCAETHEHLEQVADVGKDLGIGFLGLGFSPKWTLAETPRMPKQRYAVMTRYMPMVGSRGLDMMYRTSTIQVNLDFGDEADMVRKFRVSLALQPIATALFAASPFTEGRPNGYKSLRSEVWRDTDRKRTGMLPFVFEPGMSFDRYTEYALDVPMYFVYRDGSYIDAAGASFRDFMEGRLPQLPGERPTLDDWSDHLTTLFPEVRMKRFLEMRGADGGRWRRICALPAFWVGLLYDQSALDAAWELVKNWSAEDRQELRAAVPVAALEARFRRGTVRDIAAEAVAIARSGLEGRDRRNPREQDETIHLAFVEETMTSGRTPADDLLERYAGPWREDIDQVFTDYAF
ncbi:MAG: glutamate--cysteine ligase [Hyphomicrobiaceae bacterium]|nr:glutamate--cysteine ligase [Hyphomicrobiaceae bacterium]